MNIRDEVLALLGRIARGESPIVRVTDHRWSDGEYGDFEFSCEGWKLVFFCDGGDLDYVDSVVSPDGRHASYSDLVDGLSDVTEFLPAEENGLLLSRLVNAVRCSD